MRVMVVDDHATNRELCRFMLGPMVEHFDSFENGVGVVEAMQEMDVLPDLILLDVMMPVKDGFDTAAEIRQAFPDTLIPIIFLTVLDDHDSFERCLTLGDDFILKPVDRSVLLAKVQAHYRIVKMHKEVSNHRDELRHFHEQVQYDYTIAESIFANLMEEMSTQVEHISGIHYISTPSTVFNGDLIVVANRPHGGIYAMIADATGHGLPAAISAIPATRAFFTMAAKGLPLGDIVEEVNASLVRFLPMGMMLAASVFEIRADGLEVSWWGGGLPDAFIVDEQNNIVSKLESKHMPLGVLEGEEFEHNIEHYKLVPGQQLICYTDGVVEASNHDGEQFGQTRLEQVISDGNKTIPQLYKAVKDFATEVADDDLSILSMTFPIVSDTVSEVNDSKAVLSKVPVTSTLKYDAAILKQISVMTELRRFVSGVISKTSHLDLVCSVLSELFANAIDHGLLDLDSSIKEQEDGFFVYYQMREERLQNLTPDAWIELTMTYQPSPTKVEFRLEHNGSGFDYSKVQDTQNEEEVHGRGIVLIHELCDSLEYSNEGKTVDVVYSLDKPHAFPTSL